MKAKFELRVSASLRQIEPYSSGTPLQLEETTVVEAAEFMELCEILAQFHRLGEKIKNEKKG